MRKRKDRYTDGLEMEQFQHLSQISKYNSNYYVGFNNDLLYAKSDDDYTTVWYLIVEENTPLCLGSSYDNDKEILHNNNL